MASDINLSSVDNSCELLNHPCTVKSFKTHLVKVNVLYAHLVPCEEVFFMSINKVKISCFRMYTLLSENKLKRSFLNDLDRNGTYECSLSQRKVLWWLYL